MSNTKPSSLIQSLVSPFARDPERTLAILSAHPTMSKFAAEFADRHNVQYEFADHTDVCKYEDPLTIVTRGRLIRVLTPAGLIAGSIRIGNFSSEPEFIFTSDTIVKKERSVGYGRNTRASAKISSLLSAMKRAEEFISDKTVFDAHSIPAVRCMMHAVNRESVKNNTALTLPAPIQLALAQAFLGETVTPEEYRDEIVKAMADYKTRHTLAGNAADAVRRFANGSRLIGMWCPQGLMSGSSSDIFFTVCSMTAGMSKNFYGDTEAKNIQYGDDLKRYNSFDDIPNIAIDKTIIRAAMSETAHTKWNPLLLPIEDKYYPDIDVATGYQNHNSFWVALPKEAFSA